MTLTALIVPERHRWSELLTEELAMSVTATIDPLEEAVDPDNIHGSLQARIADAESRYAKLVHRSSNPARVRSKAGS